MSFEQAIKDGYTVSKEFDLFMESARFQMAASTHRKELRSQGYKTRTIRESINGAIVVTVMKKLK
jgi:hypothetical protein